MTFPDDELDTREAILLDTNPTFGRLVWPLLELMVITGAVSYTHLTLPTN